jgi:DUF2905 family protein
MRDIGRLLFIAGLAIAALGVLISFTRVGRLPGDLHWQRGNFGCYFPLMTSILLSIVLSILMWLFTRR